MNIKLIKTKEDYDSALARAEQLMDAKSDTPEADELELLGALIEMYEEFQYPMGMPDAVEAIKFRIEQLGIGQQGLVPFIGSRSKVSEVLNRKKSLSLAMMRGLHKGLGIPADILLQEPGANFPPDLPELDWKRFPLSEMAKKGWIPNQTDLKCKAEEYIRALIDQAGGMNSVSAMLFRRSRSARQNSKMDQYALIAWCLRVLSLARQYSLKYKKGVLNAEVLRDVAKLSYFENGPQLAREYLNKLGIILLVVPHLFKTYLDGAALLLEDGTPVIALTLRYDRIDNFWFCLLHELGHVASHLSEENSIIIDDLDLRGHRAEIPDEKEKEADRFAEESLIPKCFMQERFYSGIVSSLEIKSLAEKLRVHPVIIAGRIRFEKKNYRLLSKYVGSGEVRKHFKDF